MTNHLQQASLLKAALYVRLSREDRNKTNKEDDSESIANQKNMLLDYCKQNHIEVYDIYNDEDFRGSDRERPDFNRMILDAGQKKFNMVICKTQSRFARDMELVEKYINGKFLYWGIRFIGLVDNADNMNQNNRKQRQLVSLIDQWYLEDLSANVRATLASKRKQGLWVGAFAPFGYVKDANNKNHLIVDEEAAVIVRYIFDLYLQGFGITTIARRLNAENIPNPATYKKQHGQPFQSSHGKCSDLWHSYSIQRILSNQVYIGDTVQGIEENISYKSTKKRIKPKDEWDVVKNTHEAIVDEDVFKRVQRLRDSKPKSTNSGAPNILARKVKCLCCGGSMRVYYTGHRRYFRCNTAFFAPDRCTGMTVSENVLHREVIRQIQKLYDTYVDEQSASSKLRIVNGYQDQLAVLEKKIKAAELAVEKLDSRLKTIYIDKVDGVITPNEFQTLKSEFSAERIQQEKQIAQYREDCEKTRERMNESQNQIDIIRRYKNIQKLDFVTADTLIDHIDIGGSRNNRIIHIYWNL